VRRKLNVGSAVLASSIKLAWQIIGRKQVVLAKNKKNFYDLLLKCVYAHLN